MLVSLRKRLPGCSLFFYIMKRVVIFILFLLVLIISEYFLLNELFSERRTMILFLSLLGTIGCILALIRIFKKYLLQPKHPEAHS
jgi:hypothetical protein